ncbi:hypothetical protein GPECTOR_41g614 [Gonium pectorale]|uniref:Ion transport domain-containing protein n=1 Tax=Gonium pectorale TaxID=33097 RepID=A0A150GBC0_GONPE|nr:hypothetical protein GPECTOR_41g614 [Gonium pectorale]|eukprot:KXZ46650.1 hypothetical protein GPECTOR_41g614 [Gonium pectorale]
MQQPLNLLDVAGLALVAITLGTHIRDGCDVDAELIRGLCGVAVLVQFLRLLYYAMPVPGLGGFVSMVIEVVKDLSMFFVFLGILFVGFSTSYMVMQPELTASAVFTNQFTLIFGNFDLTSGEGAEAKPLFQTQLSKFAEDVLSTVRALQAELGQLRTAVQQREQPAVSARSEE